MILAVTGHRPDKLGGYRTPNPYFKSVMEGLDKKLMELRPETVITGMALGVDQWTAELCRFNGIPFIAAIPFSGFETRWPARSQIQYRELLSYASAVHVVSGGDYAAGKMQRRNEWMVLHSDALLAVFNGTDGGTKNCVDYARNLGKTIHYVDFIRPPPPVSVELPRNIEIRSAAEALRGINVEQRQQESDEEIRRRDERIQRIREERERERERRETEGAIAARRRAEEEIRRQEEEEARVERARQARQERLDREAAAEEARRLEEERLEREATERRLKEEEEAAKAKAPVHEFSRFVDLDV